MPKKENKDKEKEILTIDGIDLYICKSCNNIHMNLHDIDGKLLAQAVLSISFADEMGDKLFELAEDLRNRKAGL